MAKNTDNPNILIPSKKISEIINQAKIPIDLIQGGLFEFLDGLGYENYQVHISPDQLVKTYKLDLWMRKGYLITKNILDKIALTLALEDDFFGAIELIAEGNEFRLILLDVNLSLCVSRDYVIPIEIANGKPILTAEKKIKTIGGSALSFETNCRLEVDTSLNIELLNASNFKLGAFKIANCPIAFIPMGVVVDLSEISTPEVIAAINKPIAFQGLYFESLHICFREELQFLPDIEAAHFLIGQDGLSGEFNLTELTDAKCEFFGLEIQVQELAMVVSENQISSINAQILTGLIPFKNELGETLMFEAAFEFKDNQYAFKFDEIDSLKLFETQLSLEDFILEFNDAGIQETKIVGELAFPVLQLENGDPAAFNISFEMKDGGYIIKADEIPPMKLGAVEINLKPIHWTLTDQLHELAVGAELKFPFINSVENSLDFDFKMENDSYQFSSARIPALKFFDLNLDLEESMIKIKTAQLDQFDMKGDLQLPFLSDSNQQITFKTSYKEEQLKAEIKFEKAFEFAGLKLEMDNSSIHIDSGSLADFSLGGTLNFPELKSSSSPDEVAKIQVKLSKDGDWWKFEASADEISEFKLGGLIINFNSFSLKINELTKAYESDIHGTLRLSGSDNTLDIELGIESDGFLIKASLDHDVKVLDIENAVEVYFRKLELGKKESKWQFDLGGKLYNHFKIPALDKFLPEFFDFNKFESSGDGFDFDFDIAWPNGKIFKGFGSGTDSGSSFPLNLNFKNLFSIQSLGFDLPKINTKNLDIKLSFQGMKFNIGPITAVVDGLSFDTSIKLGDGDGNFGPLDIGFDIGYPTGLGISLDTDLIRGGGYLFYEKENKRYAGALELTFQDSISLSAIGLLTTELPDGSQGTSLLIMITTEFPTPITLGYNFYLSAVGGIMGIHRTSSSDQLREAVRTGTIDHILFPKNVIENIHTIVSNLRGIFPAKKDQFLLGPMALITWGYPTMMRIELGVIMEFADPTKLAILGVVKLGVPTVDKPLIKLNVSFIGIINFDKAKLSFDATLYDSKIMSFILEGDMALRLSWGSRSDFALSVGGFHPAYRIPNYLGMSAMDRLTVSLMTGNPRLNLTTYFAVTTNSVQFGALVDFYLKAWKIKVVGFFGFDVLFLFNPFQFIAEVVAGLAVKWGSRHLFSIGLKFKLIGPSPWMASGYAKFSILWTSVKAKFNTTFGPKRESILPAVNVLPMLVEELNKATNWRAELEESRFELLKFKEILPQKNTVSLHPMGSLSISQSIVPLGLEIERYGSSTPLGANLFYFDQLSVIQDGRSISKETTPTYGEFAPGSFKDLSKEDKLKSPSYEKLTNGVKLYGVDQFFANYCITREIEYERIISDRLPENVSAKFSFSDEKGRLTPDEMTKWAKGGEIANSPLSKRKRRKMVKNRTFVQVIKEERFMLVYAENLKPYQEIGFSSGTETAAKTALDNLCREQPKIKGKVIIASEFQVAE